MQIGTLYIPYNPGDTYADAEPEASEPQKEKSRGEARAAAIEQFKKAARDQTLPGIQQAAANLLALLIQYKALGGNMADTPLPDQLREAADFMEDV